MSWHHHLFPCICVSISPGGLGGHWTQRPIHTVLSEYLQGTRRNSRHFGRWRRLLVLSHYWVAIVLFRWSKAGNKNRISNEGGLSLFAGKVKSFISQWKPSATIALVIVKATEKKRHRKQCYLGLVLLRRRQSKAREPSSLLPVNAVLFLTIYIWLFCTFIQSESSSAYLTFLASISKIIYFEESVYNAVNSAFMSRQNTSVSLKTRQGLFLIMPTMLRKGNIILRVHNVPPIVHWLILKALVWYCGRKSLEA